MVLDPFLFLNNFGLESPVLTVVLKVICTGVGFGSGTEYNVNPATVSPMPGFWRETYSVTNAWFLERNLGTRLTDAYNGSVHKAVSLNLVAS